MRFQTAHFVVQNRYDEPTVTTSSNHYPGQMSAPTYSNKQVRAALRQILEFVIGSIVFLLMMVGTVLLMAVLEPSFFSNWF